MLVQSPEVPPLAGTDRASDGDSDSEDGVAVPAGYSMLNGFEEDALDSDEHSDGETAMPNRDEADDGDHAAASAHEGREGAHGAAPFAASAGVGTVPAPGGQDPDSAGSGGAQANEPLENKSRLSEGDVASIRAAMSGLDLPPPEWARGLDVRLSRPLLHVLLTHASSRGIAACTRARHSLCA
jgi:hypothetical protein